MISKTKRLTDQVLPPFEPHPTEALAGHALGICWYLLVSLGILKCRKQTHNEGTLLLFMNRVVLVGLLSHSLLTGISQLQYNPETLAMNVLICTNSLQWPDCSS